MPELFDREAAFAAIDRWAYTQEGWYDHPDLEQIQDTAKAILRALPAVDRRCATCRYWNELRADSEFGDCWGNTKLPTYRRNHYCAAWHPLEAQP